MAAPLAKTRAAELLGGINYTTRDYLVMSDTSTPRPYEQWRADGADREEDAAYTFGYYLMHHCRAEALKRVQSAPVLMTRKQFQKEVEEAVDRALCGVMDMLEGFWPLKAGPNHKAAFALSVCVSDMNEKKQVERIDISPCRIDLPIGYWKWKDGEFR